MLSAENENSEHNQGLNFCLKFEWIINIIFQVIINNSFSVALEMQHEPTLYIHVKARLLCLQIFNFGSILCSCHSFMIPCKLFGSMLLSLREQKKTQMRLQICVWSFTVHNHGKHLSKCDISHISCWLLYLILKILPCCG